MIEDEAAALEDQVGFPQKRHERDSFLIVLEVCSEFLEDIVFLDGVLRVKDGGLKH